MKSLWVLRSCALRGKLEIAGGCFSRRRASWYGSVCVRVRVSGWRGGAAKHMKSLWVSKGWALRGKLEIAGGCFSRVRAVWYGPGAPRVIANRWLLFLSGAGALMREWVRARARARARVCVRAVVAALAFTHAARVLENMHFFGALCVFLYALGVFRSSPWRDKCRVITDRRLLQVVTPDR